MPYPITVNKASEFFIAVAKVGVHSFVMLGVMVDGKPQLLARVGKGNLIDEYFGTSCIKKIGLFGKIVGSHSDASLVNEYFNNSQGISDISYQAYSITYEQYLEFLAITRDIHDDQLEHYKERVVPNRKFADLTYPERGVYKLRKGIDCYVPGEEKVGQITFTYNGIDTFSKASNYSNKQIRQDIIGEAKEIKASNTCRTTARSLLNYTLGYSPNVPALYLMGLDYKTKLFQGGLTANTFYILPSPPNCFKKINPTQMKVLKELYEKLEDLPKNEPSSEVTRNKFEELKHLYKEIAGEPQLSLQDLLDKITLHRTTHNSLFDIRRGQNIVSKFVEALGFKTKTGTQQAYDRMENAVNEEIDRVNKDKTIEEIGVEGGDQFDFPRLS